MTPNKAKDDRSTNLSENGNNLAEFTQKLWQEEAGIDLTLDEAQEVADNLRDFFDILNEWEEKRKRREEGGFEQESLAG